MALMLYGLVSCEKDDEKVIVASQVQLNKTSLSLQVGDSEQLKVSFTPENVTDTSIEWKIEDESLVDVTENGTITALKIGKTVITASSSNTKIATCEVTITAKVIEATSIELGNTELTLRIDEKSTLSVRFIPDNTTDKTLIWTSKDEAVAKVVDGEITAIGTGKTTITASTANNKVSTCEVTVIQPVESISLPETFEIKKGESTVLVPTIVPANAEYGKIIWTISDETVATVDETGKVEGLKVAEVNITATVEGTDKTCTCKLRVNPRGTVLFGLVGSWGSKYCTTVWGDKEFSEEGLFDYSGGNPKIEEKFAMHKTMYDFTIHDDDTVSLDFIPKNETEVIHLEGTLVKSEEKDNTYTGTFPTEEVDAKVIDFQYVYNQYMHSYEVMISIPSDCSPGWSEERIYFQKKL